MSKQDTTTDPRAAAEEALRLHEAVKTEPCSPSCPGCNGLAGWPCPLAEKARVDMQRRERELLPILARAVIEGHAQRATMRGPMSVANTARQRRECALLRHENEHLRTELAAAKEEAEAAKLGDRLSEEQTADLWHAIEAVAEGCSPEQWAKHRATLDTNGTDAEPLETIRAELASLRGTTRHDRYDALTAEHRALAVKEVLRTITESEAGRLVDLRAEIDRLETAMVNRPALTAERAERAHREGWGLSSEARDLWDAINEFATTTGTSVARQHAVCKVEDAIIATVKRAAAGVVGEGDTPRVVDTSERIDTPSLLTANKGPRWMTIVFREGQQLPTTIGLFSEQDDAAKHHTTAGAQWSDSYLCRVVRGPNDGRSEGQREPAADMAAPSGPVCACGAPSAHESGWCGKSHLRTPPRPVPLTEAEARATGIYRKFDVRRTDGSSAPGGKHERCDYYVLDWQHDPFAVPAALAYAAACESEYPALADDIRKRAKLAASRRAIPLEVRAGETGSVDERIRGCIDSLAVDHAQALAASGPTPALPADYAARRAMGEGGHGMCEPVDVPPILSGEMAVTTGEEWHPFTPGMASAHLCCFCGKTAGEHGAARATEAAKLTREEAKKKLLAMGYTTARVDLFLDDARNELAWHEANGGYWATDHILRAYVAHLDTTGASKS